MPYDPSFPADHILLVASEFRSQFTGLADNINSIPAGPQGIPGPPGAGVANAVVDSVSTLNPGDAVAVTVSYDVVNNTMHLSFGIPKGNDGTNGSNGAPFTNFVIDSITMLDPNDTPSAQATFDGTAVHLAFNIPRGFSGSDGINGINGIDGGIGPIGPAGAAVANAIIDAVNTLNAGDNATVSTIFDSSSNTVHYTFGIPRGFDGSPGTNGIDGEVSNATLATAISGTSTNSNAVGTLDTPFADPDMDAMRLKMNELILALRR